MGLFERILNEPVRTLALRPAICMHPSDSVRDAVAAMRRERLGCVIVIDELDRPFGAFTERSITHALDTRSLDPEDALERHVDASWAKVGVDDPIRAVLQAMNSRGTRFVSVTGDDGEAVAITGQKGIVECVAEYFPEPIRVSTRRVGHRSCSKAKEGA